MFLIVIIIIALAVLGNSVPLILGFLKTPPGQVFLGTVHHPFDYFAYVSQFAQGRESTVWTQNLYTHESARSVLVGSVNVLFGKLWSLIHVSPIVAYQLSIILFTIVFLSLTYLFIKELSRGTKGHRWQSIVTIILFITASPFPVPAYTGNAWHITFVDPWFSFGNPFARLGFVPHHLILRISILSIFLLTILLPGLSSSGKRALAAIALATSSLLAANIDPVQWLLTATTLVIVAAISALFGVRLKHRKPPPEKPTSTFFAPAIITALAGLPMVLYLRTVFSRLPYSQLSGWELTQQVRISPFSYLLANGPVAILALAGIWWYGRRLNHAKLLLLVFTVLGLSLFFSPLPQMAGLSNVRFTSPFNMLLFAGACAELIHAVSARWSARRSLAAGLIVGALVIVSVPATVSYVQKYDATVEINSVYHYLPPGVIQFFEQTKSISSFGDSFLVLWPYNVPFPGITGRRSYFGHPLLTIDNQQKEWESYEFFGGKMDSKRMQAFLLYHKIDYVIAYTNAMPLQELPILTKALESPILTLYRVQKSTRRVK